jgi:hypothetical protein
LPLIARSGGKRRSGGPHRVRPSGEAVPEADRRRLPRAAIAGDDGPLPVQASSLTTAPDDGRRNLDPPTDGERARAGRLPQIAQ